MPVITFKYQDLKDLGIDMEKDELIDTLPMMSSDIEDFDDEVDIDEFKDEISYKISIWDSCHESDLGILYCTADDIEINDNRLTINCSGEHVYGSMTELADSDDEIEFEMFVPFKK